MSRVLLINAPFRLRSPIPHTTELLGIEYLASNVRENGHEIAVYDPTLKEPLTLSDGMYYFGASLNEMKEYVMKFSPDVVGISCHYGFAASDAYAVATIVKETDKQIITVMGGLFVSVHRTKPLRECAYIDFALEGEAENTFVQLLSHISVKVPDLESIEGLIYKTNGEIKHNVKKTFITDLDALPFPARDLVNISAYMRGSEVKRLYGLGFKPSLSLLASRSCPNRCTFCNMYMVHGPAWRPRSVDGVIAELQEMTGKYHAQHIFIMDDNFTLKIDRAKQICEEMIDNVPINIRWNTPNGISVKGMDPELARLMKRAGCANVCIAIESGSEYLRMTVMNKKITNNEIVNAVECFKAAGVPIVGFIVLGCPGETEERFNETVAFLKRLPLTSIVVSYAVPFPGTTLRRQLVDSGILKDDDTVLMDDLNVPCYSTPDFAREDLVRRKQVIKDMFPSLALLYEIEVNSR